MHRLMKRVLSLLLLSMLSTLAAGAPPLQKTTVIDAQDRAAFLRSLKINGSVVKGSIAASKTRIESARSQSFPHFSGAFTYNGVEYGYTMVGNAPATGKAASLRAVIIPLRLNFVHFEQDVSFDPAVAVQRIVRSPIFNEAAFPNGIGQFGDMLQRATFWNRMDEKRSWHVTFDKVRVLPTVDVRVGPELGELLQIGPAPTDILGIIGIDVMDSTIHTLLQFIDVQPDELPIFVTQNAIAEAPGYHDAFLVQQKDGSEVLRTLIYASWLDVELVGPLFADIVSLSHEVADWLNDPYGNNTVPAWNFPGTAVCGNNALLEVGDPQGNGPNFADFPTVAVPLGGFTYHVQDVVMLPWFAIEAPSSAQNGWYDFPDTTQITSPATLCAP